MSNRIEDVNGKTVVVVKVPVCITIQMDEADARGMGNDELAGLIDEFIDEVQSTWSVTTNGDMRADLHPRRWMNRIPVRCDICRHWDEMPEEECEVMSNDDGFFE